MKKILTIKKVNFTGKWAEFWFEEEPHIIPADPDSEYEHLRVEQDCWTNSCKAYQLHNLVELGGLIDEVDNNGFKGLKMEWNYKSPNWSPTRIFKETKTPRTYSEEEVEKLLIDCKNTFSGSELQDYHSDQEVKIWFRKYKNKICHLYS